MDNPNEPRIGVAMIARNAEELMPLALDPIVEHVDEVAIVLGGISTDNTPELAAEYATLPVEPFKGKVDDQGRLMSFAEARQQSFNILERAGVEYAFVVDTDDQWTGVEHLRKILAEMARGGFPMCMFPYRYEGGEFVQPRIYRIDSGHWEGPCHNYWDIPGDRVAMQTDMMHLRQERPEGHGKNRRLQNFAISDAYMAEHGDNCRLLLHMARDSMVERDMERAEDALNRYFVAFEHDKMQDPEELYTAHHTMAAIHIIRGRFKDALVSAFNALSVRGHAQSWAIASEAAGWVAQESQQDTPMLKLSEFCATMATEVGNPRGNLHWQSDRLNGPIPLFLRARALTGLGEYRRARGYCDLGLAIMPEHEEMNQLRRDIARRLGQLP